MEITKHFEINIENDKVYTIINGIYSSNYNEEITEELIRIYNDALRINLHSRAIWFRSQVAKNKYPAFCKKEDFKNYYAYNGEIVDNIRILIRKELNNNKPFDYSDLELIGYKEFGKIYMFPKKHLTKQ